MSEVGKAEGAFQTWKADNAGLMVSGPIDWAAFYAGWCAAMCSLDQPSLFDDAGTPRFRTLSGEPRVIPSRSTDPATSHAATRNITVKAGTQRARLLQAFAHRDLFSRLPVGLTDEEAMHYARGVDPFSEYSKRCSELREAGLIEPTGETREGSSGQARMVSRITDKGREAVKGL